ncbi:MAG TPA: helix-turn-helix transcriptional regulator [Candidatus Limnocylindria bacterium]|jgi:transcriptional regulator with XRE-family HTH domain|nr:helix-turn-helix transcriptional regulator [Candidatus Limnocylindria bacterium]
MKAKRLGRSIAPSAGLPVAALLRDGRLQAGLFRDEVAERLGWPAGHLAALETGRRLPLLSEVVSLSRLYGLDLEFFRPSAATQPEAGSLQSLATVVPFRRPRAEPTLPEAA